MSENQYVHMNIRQYPFQKYPPFTINHQLTSADSFLAVNLGLKSKDWFFFFFLLFSPIKMSCTKASVFIKSEETFILFKNVILGFIMTVKGALIKEFQDGRRSRWEFFHLEIL